ncbi:hypothetical protein GCM10023147_13310 [Tsukamurella soli]|uniref:Uncharacterized protein n=1 Tax=Tsukamurella soli TaxID=644556 RepID=A0ABP8JB60_9ACTN
MKPTSYDLLGEQETRDLQNAATVSATARIATHNPASEDYTCGEPQGKTEEHPPNAGGETP